MKTTLTTLTIEEKENLINDFATRLITGDYKVILYNNQNAYTSDDIMSLAEIICYSLDEESIVKFKNKNTLFIHTEDEIIELKGRKRMSDGEIFARQYLDECDGELIVKDDEEQVEMREDNFHDAKKFYNKCKEIINIRGFFDKNNPNYKMNWDCIWVAFRNGDKMLWQRC